MLHNDLGFGSYAKILNTCKLNSPGKTQFSFYNFVFDTQFSQGP